MFDCQPTPSSEEIMPTGAAAAKLGVGDEGVDDVALTNEADTHQRLGSVGDPRRHNPMSSGRRARPVRCRRSAF